LVLLTEKADALWVTSAPMPDYTRHAWAGAWICSFFRNESQILSSELIKQAVAATRWYYEYRPLQGMVTFINTEKVRKKRDWGRCYRKAGFAKAKCPRHFDLCEKCNACKGLTEEGLIALQLLPASMPAASPPMGATLDLFEECV
jgi:hypothetical protein